MSDAVRPDQRRDLVVLSDLHMGEGRFSDSRRFSPTEDFFHDSAFARLIDHLIARYKNNPERLALVLNGDTFDFLTVTTAPSAEEAARLGFEVTTAERKFGLNPTGAKSVYKLDLIAKGHRGFFEALARFVAAGHRVEILRGNHDLELYFDEVRERLLEKIAGFEGGPDLATAKERVRFHQMFYLEPGRIYIEHGNQYDSSNSIRYPLRPILPDIRKRRKKREKMLDYPMGSIFVRFFYNRVRSIDPHAPRLLTFDQYLDFILRYNVFDVWKIYKDHYPYFLAAIGPTTPTGSSGSSEKADAKQEAELNRLASEAEYGELYRRINDMKILPVSASKIAITKEMVAPVLRRSLWFGVFAFAALFFWLFVLQLIDMVPWIAANTFLMSIFAVLTVAGLLWTWAHFSHKMQHSRKPATNAENCKDRADKIARTTEVRAVLMGHTHIVDLQKVNDGKAIYANGGTWTSVKNPWNRIMRDARRMTFLFVEGDDVNLCRWNDDASRIDDVPLFHNIEHDIVQESIVVAPLKHETRDAVDEEEKSDFKI